MCLDRISKKKPAPEGYGYKVFELTDGRLYGELARREKVRPVGTWLKSRNYAVPKKNGIITPIKGRYPVGWHIYKSLKGIKDWVYGTNPEWYVIKKIRYRLAHTEGTTDGYKVIVAKEIYITP